MPALRAHRSTTGHRLGINGSNLDPATICVDAASENGAVSPLLAAILASLPAWHADALCAEFDLEPWFPTKGQSNQPALDDPTLDFGLRGGMTANARKLARHRKRF